MNWNSVYKLVKKIPRGRVTTYGGIARALKLRGGARPAGRAMAACPSGRGIPWHRVVGAGGRLLLREPNISLQRSCSKAKACKSRKSASRILRSGTGCPARRAAGSDLKRKELENEQGWDSLGA